GETVLRVEALQLGVFEQLANPALKEIMTLAKRIGDRLQNVKFDAAIPHLDQRALLRIGAEQRRLGMEFLEVTADSNALGNISTIVELEHRNRAQRIFPAKLFVAIHRLDDIDFFVGDLDSF